MLWFGRDLTTKGSFVPYYFFYGEGLLLFNPRPNAETCDCHWSPNARISTC